MYTKISVLTIPVGNTRMLSFFENKTLRSPKIIAIISRTKKYVGVSWYSENNQSNNRSTFKFLNYKTTNLRLLLK